METPVSPVMGHVLTPGTASLSALLQLLNPTDSGKRVRVFELRASQLGEAGGTVLLKQRRTKNPLTLSGTVAVGVVRRLDTRATDFALPAVVAQLRGATNTANVTFLERVSQAAWNDRTEDAMQGHDNPILVPGMFPLSLLPGSAWEALCAIGATARARLQVVWDEVAYVLGETP